MSETDEFFEALRKKSSLKSGTTAFKAKSSDFMDHLKSISGDPSGSPIEKYFSAENAKLFKTFVAIADKTRWAGAVDLTMEKPIMGRAAWKKGQTVKHPLTKKVLFDEVSSVRGYKVGMLGSIVAQPVAICSDGLLRSQRGKELTESAALGWGRLPDAEILEDNLVGEAPNFIIPIRANRLLSWPEILARVLPNDTLDKLG